MTLATRCSACGTVFRAAPDQLRASDGWVRCGRCNSVFNAAEVLFDMDSGTAVVLDVPDGLDVLDGLDTPAYRQAVAAAPQPQPPAGPQFDDLAGPAPVDNPWPDPDLAGATHLPPAASGAPHDGPMLRAPSSDGDDSIHIFDQPPQARAPLALNPMDGPLGRLAGLDGVLGQTTIGAAQPHAAGPVDPAAADHGRQQRSEPRFDPATPHVSALVPDGAAGAAAPTRDAHTGQHSGSSWPAPDAGVPSFLRTAERHAGWQSAAMRRVGAVAAVLLGLAALLQWALLAHDSLAAYLPASAPALRALCRVAGCQLQPLRRLDALAVGSTGLNRVEDAAQYRLQLVLHNRANIAVMMPALELSLTDPQGQLVSRRVLQLADLGLAQAVIGAGQDVPIKVLLAAGAQRIDGYSVDLFYP